MRSAIAVLELVHLDAQRQSAIRIVEYAWRAKASQLPAWWQWTSALAAGITIRKIEAIGPSR